jgi:hypothetical protein
MTACVDSRNEVLEPSSLSVRAAQAAKAVQCTGCADFTVYRLRSLYAISCSVVGFVPAARCPRRWCLRR